MAFLSYIYIICYYLSLFFLTIFTWVKYSHLMQFAGLKKAGLGILAEMGPSLTADGQRSFV
jgi:hypothetical protein